MTDRVKRYHVSLRIKRPGAKHLKHERLNIDEYDLEQPVRLDGPTLSEVNWAVRNVLRWLRLNGIQGANFTELHVDKMEMFYKEDQEATWRV